MSLLILQKEFSKNLDQMEEVEKLTTKPDGSPEFKENLKIENELFRLLEDLRAQISVSLPESEKFNSESEIVGGLKLLELGGQTAETNMEKMLEWNYISLNNGNYSLYKLFGALNKSNDENLKKFLSYENNFYTSDGSVGHGSSSGSFSPWTTIIKITSKDSELRRRASIIRKEVFAGQK